MSQKKIVIFGNKLITTTHQYNETAMFFPTLWKNENNASNCTLIDAVWENIAVKNCLQQWEVTS